MIRIIAAFIFISLLSMVFHLVLGGDTTFRWQQIVVRINLKDLLVSVLLICNLLAIVLLLRKKSF